LASTFVAPKESCRPRISLIENDDLLEEPLAETDRQALPDT
jgi:hypothetical protein